MLEKKVIFILGAGASVPYGLPTSSELKAKILSDLQGNPNDYLNAGFPPGDCREFARAFVGSNIDTLDFFLNKPGNEYFANIGKFSICRIIANCENYNTLIGTENFERDNYKFSNSSRALSEGWYKILWQQMNHVLEDFSKNSRFSFITFNYDRSLEHFLFTSFSHLFSRAKLNAAQVAEHLNQIRIIHVHGQLAPLPWQSTDPQGVLPYGDPPSNSEKIRKLTKNIKVIHESNESDASFEEARSHIIRHSDAEIVFMGFGFHEDNLLRLSLDHLKRPDNKGDMARGLLADHESIHATVYGMSGARVRRAVSLIGKPVNLFEMDCATFLDRHL